MINHSNFYAAYARFIGRGSDREFFDKLFDLPEEEVKKMYIEALEKELKDAKAKACKNRK